MTGPEGSPSPEVTTGWGALALSAARAGASAITDAVAGGAIGLDHKSAGHDLVTTADQASEQAIVTVIRRSRPADSILAEESGRSDGTTDVRWLVDPLDGTANFVHGRPDFAVSVAVERQGRIIAGAIVRPATGQWAMADDGTLTSDGFGRLCSLLPGSAAGDPAAADAMVTVGMPYPLTTRSRVLHLVADLVPSVRAVRVVGSAAGDLLAVACGTCDAFVGFGLAPWDTAAGHALVEAAGGRVDELSIDGITVLLAGRRKAVTEIGAAPASHRFQRRLSRRTLSRIASGCVLGCPDRPDPRGQTRHTDLRIVLDPLHRSRFGPVGSSGST